LHLALVRRDLLRQRISVRFDSLMYSVQPAECKWFTSLMAKAEVINYVAANT
jgi:hypothetical protein